MSAASDRELVLDYERPPAGHSRREIVGAVFCIASWAISGLCVLIPVLANNLNESQLSWEHYQDCFQACSCGALIGAALGVATGLVAPKGRVRDAGVIAVVLNLLAAIVIPALMHG